MKEKSMSRSSDDLVIEHFEEEENQTDEYSKDIAAMIKALATLTNTENLELKTDLNSPQIIAITQGKTFANKYKSNAMTNLCNNFMALNYSKDRKSRAEIVQAIQATSQRGSELEEMENSKSSILRLLGRWSYA